MSCWDNITPPSAGWHADPDLEWKTGSERKLIPKSPVMPTSVRVPRRRTGTDAPAKPNQQMTAEKASKFVPKKGE